MSDTGIKLLKAEQQKIIKEAIKYFSVHKLGDNPNDIDILKLQEFFDLKCDIINKQNATNQKV